MYNSREPGMARGGKYENIHDIKKFENEINISHHKLNNNYSQKCVLNANHFVGNNGILNRLNENCSTLTRRCRLAVF